MNKRVGRYSRYSVRHQLGMREKLIRAAVILLIGVIKLNRHSGSVKPLRLVS